jgi:formate hydrogenlyase subunit 4
MKLTTYKTMTPMFWVGAVLVATCSCLLAIAVIASVVMSRPLTPFEAVIAFVFAIGFAAVVVFSLWRKAQKK